MDEAALQQRLAALPVASGVYLFKARDGRVLYVGKARNLRSRVRSYFAPKTSDERAFIAGLRGELGELTTLVTQNEKEAALLENQLIKAEQPRYNIKLRDDKEYLSLRLDTRVAWPRVQVVRKPRSDGADYFGPYPSATAARATGRLLQKHFQLRTCSDREFAQRSRPCLQYHIKRCPAPCVLPVDAVAYGEEVERVRRFLKGAHQALLGELKSRMQACAAQQDYEYAARYRDQLRAIEKVAEAQAVTSHQEVDQDVIGLFRREQEVEMALLAVRGGRLIGVHTFSLRRVLVPDDEVLANFCRAYYGEGAVLPPTVLLPKAIEAEAGLAAWLSELAGRRVRVAFPQRGPRRQVLRLALDQAAHAFEEKARGQAAAEAQLAQLQQLLGLPKVPERIECVDVSHHGGLDTVAVLTAAEGGELLRSGYRSFRVRQQVAGDDYAAMYEVLLRRFKRAEKGGRWALPELLVVDGGRGQLARAEAARADAQVEGVTLVGLAKAREDGVAQHSTDRVFRVGVTDPIAVTRAPAAFRILQQLRDEAHRASNALREKQAKRRTLSSPFDGVPGLGPVTRRKLQRQGFSLDDLRSLSDAALQELGLNAGQRRKLREHFAKHSDPEAAS